MREYCKSKENQKRKRRIKKKTNKKGYQKVTHAFPKKLQVTFNKKTAFRVLLTDGFCKCCVVFRSLQVPILHLKSLRLVIT